MHEKKHPTKKVKEFSVSWRFLFLKLLEISHSFLLFFFNLKSCMGGFLLFNKYGAQGVVQCFSLIKTVIFSFNGAGIMGLKSLKDTKDIFVTGQEICIKMELDFNKKMIYFAKIDWKTKKNISTYYSCGLQHFWSDKIKWWFHIGVNQPTTVDFC